MENSGSVFLVVFSQNCLCSPYQWELIVGPDLLDLLNEHGGKLPEAMACYYFVQLLEAVRHMHDMGFCHRCANSRETIEIIASLSFSLGVLPMAILESSLQQGNRW